MRPVDPVIVVPGITASNLRDEYPVDPERVWSVMPVVGKKFERVALHPANLRYENLEPARVQPDGVFDVPYGELIEELRYNLTDNHAEPVPVYPFAYDWRQPLEATVQLLAEFIDEVIDRTLLMPHYANSGFKSSPRVNLVGHSMGGLVITGYLQKWGAEAGINKVVTLGTPFRGSLEAPLKITTGTAELGNEGTAASRQREAARVTPALYHLLPTFEGALDVATGLPDTLFDPGAWQPGIRETLKSYIERTRLYKKSDVSSAATKLFETLLGEGRTFLDRMNKLQLDQIGMQAKHWLCIVGLNATTRVKLRIERRNNAPYFDLTSDHRVNEWESIEKSKRVLTGDGTVPYLGACPNFLKRENLVCVIPSDFGYWELSDRLLLPFAGFHGLLPKLNLAHRLIVSHLKSESRKGTWGRKAPDAKGKWESPIPGLKEKVEK